MGVSTMTMNFLLTILFLLTLSCVKSDKPKSNEHVVLVSPVLAPSTGSRARLTETAKDFPLLMLLAGDKPQITEEGLSPKGEIQPVYVKKLEDQNKKTKRRRRRFSKITVIRRLPNSIENFNS